MQQDNHITVVCHSSTIPQISQTRTFLLQCFTIYSVTIQLGKNNHGNLQLLGQLFQATSNVVQVKITIIRISVPCIEQLYIINEYDMYVMLFLNLTGHLTQLVYMVNHLGFQIYVSIFCRS